MEDIKTANAKQHNLTLEGREKLYISGVTDVGSFNDNTVTLSTQIGELIIKGDDLHISSLDINAGNVLIKGFIISCIYTESGVFKKEKGFLKSIFK